MQILTTKNINIYTFANPNTQVATIKDFIGYNFSTNASIATGYITFKPIPLKIFNKINAYIDKYYIVKASRRRAKNPIKVVIFIKIS